MEGIGTVNVGELLEYNKVVRLRYFECFTRLSWQQFIENREASFGSIRNIFLHALGAADYWLDFLQKEKLFSRREYDDYRTFQEVKDYMEHVETRLHKYLSLHSAGLQEKYIVKSEEKDAIIVTAEDVLIHIFEEEVHHRGEIIALLWQIGVEPPPMEWKEL